MSHFYINVTELSYDSVLALICVIIARGFHISIQSVVSVHIHSLLNISVIFMKRKWLTC